MIYSLVRKDCDATQVYTTGRETPFMIHESICEEPQPTLDVSGAYVEGDYDDTSIEGTER
jgi:hypothetical protein